MRKQSDKPKLINNCKTTGLDSLKMSKAYKDKKFKRLGNYSRCKTDKRDMTMECNTCSLLDLILQKGKNNNCKVPY